MKFEKTLFGKLSNQDIYLYTFENENNVKFSVTNYGGIVSHLYTPDKNNISDDIVLGFDKLDNYIEDHPYFGALIGRFGNRIDFGKFTLEDVDYSLVQNNGSNHLHGGTVGFDKVVWEIKNIIQEDDKGGLALEYISKDGEEGYPGTLTTQVNIYITNNDELVFDYSAKTDKTTIINLTHHGYFNLNGMKDTVLNHQMEINADTLTSVDEKSIPTGELLDVKNTSFDFTKPKLIGEQIEQAGGYDHNYVINKNNNELSYTARVTDKTSGRVMEVYTTEPGVQFYSANYLDGSIIGKNNVKYNKHYAFCLETQHFPDAPNKDHFPSTVLKPGETYKQTTIYKFSTLK